MVRRFFPIRRGRSLFMLPQNAVKSENLKSSQHKSTFHKMVRYCKDTESENKPRRFDMKRLTTLAAVFVLTLSLTAFAFKLRHSRHRANRPGQQAPPSG